jgi:ribosomal protein L11 methyltransferase
VAPYLELSFDLGSLDAQRAEDASIGCGAAAVTFVDAHDDPRRHPTQSASTRGASSPVLEPAPGEFRLWPATRVQCLFTAEQAPQALANALAAALGIDAALIETREIPDRIWEREWLKDFHARRFGERLWVCPRHERVGAPGAVVVQLDPGLAFGTGTHPSTALCLLWLDAHLQGPPAPAKHFVERQAHGLDAHLQGPPAPPGALVIDYGCGSGILGLAAAKLGAAEVHAFDIDPQALVATRENAHANALDARLVVHATAGTLPCNADLLVANILSGTLCALAAQFAALVRPRGQIVLGGLMEHETADVTDAYAAWFDVARVADCDGWVCLAGRRR